MSHPSPNSSQNTTGFYYGALVASPGVIVQTPALSQASAGGGTSISITSETHSESRSSTLPPYVSDTLHPFVAGQVLELHQYLANLLTLVRHLTVDETQRSSAILGILRQRVQVSQLKEVMTNLHRCITTDICHPHSSILAIHLDTTQLCEKFEQVSVEVKCVVDSIESGPGFVRAADRNILATICKELLIHTLMQAIDAVKELEMELQTLREKNLAPWAVFKRNVARVGAKFYGFQEYSRGFAALLHLVMVHIVIAVLVLIWKCSVPSNLYGPTAHNITTTVAFNQSMMVALERQGSPTTSCSRQLEDSRMVLSWILPTLYYDITFFTLSSFRFYMKYDVWTVPFLLSLITNFAFVMDLFPAEICANSVECVTLKTLHILVPALVTCYAFAVLPRIPTWFAITYHVLYMCLVVLDNFIAGSHAPQDPFIPAVESVLCLISMSLCYHTCFCLGAQKPSEAGTPLWAKWFLIRPWYVDEPSLGVEQLHEPQAPAKREQFPASQSLSGTNEQSSVDGSCLVKFHRSNPLVPSSGAAIGRSGWIIAPPTVPPRMSPSMDPAFSEHWMRKVLVLDTRIYQVINKIVTNQPFSVTLYPNWIEHLRQPEMMHSVPSLFRQFDLTFIPDSCEAVEMLKLHPRSEIFHPSGKVVAVTNLPQPPVTGILPSPYGGGSRTFSTGMVDVMVDIQQLPMQFPVICRGTADTAATSTSNPAQQHPVLIADVCVPPLQFEEYTVLRSAGKGSQSTVDVVQEVLEPTSLSSSTRRHPPAIFIRKTLWDLDCDVNIQFDQVFQIEMLKLNLRHPNLVQMYAVRRKLESTNDESAGRGKRRLIELFMEFCSNGTLKAHVAEGPLPQAEASRWTREILLGLNNLHAYGFYHGDLKADNVLIGNQGEAKLCDYCSMYQALAFTPPEKLEVNTPKNMHQDGGLNEDELDKDKKVDGKRAGVLDREAADVWSLGCVMLQMMHGRGYIPFQHVQQSLPLYLLSLVGKRSFEIPFPKATQEQPTSPKVEVSSERQSSQPQQFNNAEKDWIDFTKKCLQPLPEKRPKVKELLMHPFVMNKVKEQQSSVLIAGLTKVGGGGSRHSSHVATSQSDTLHDSMSEWSAASLNFYSEAPSKDY